MSMNDDVPAAAGEDRPSGRTADASRRSGRAKRSGTFVYPLPSTPLPSSTPLTSTPDTGTHRTRDASSLEGDPAGGVGAGNSEEGTTLVSSTGTNGSASGPATTTTTATESLGTVTAPSPVLSRRNSMGVASVRIAARLAQNELTSRDSRNTGSHGDPIADDDELLTLLGEYLLAGGLEKPEIHATLGGQPIVVDLQVPQRRAR
ncbi:MULTISPECIES: hypothetical protein [Rhodococcus]|nr:MULTISPECIES: hypothetical protein [Rhodococcus]UTT50597.1 hypothetical protein NMQ04_04935 [Rhodococcus gordoniae]